MIMSTGELMRAVTRLMLKANFHVAWLKKANKTLRWNDVNDGDHGSEVENSGSGEVEQANYGVFMPATGQCQVTVSYH